MEDDKGVEETGFADAPWFKAATPVHLVQNGNGDDVNRGEGERKRRRQNRVVEGRIDRKGTSERAFVGRRSECSRLWRGREVEKVPRRSTEVIGRSRHG